MNDYKSRIRPFDWWQNQRPIYALYCRKDASFGAYHKNLNELKTDPYYRQQKCSPMTLLSGDKGLYGYSRGFIRGVKRQYGCRQRQFSAISLAISSETLEMRSALLYSDKQSVVGFPVMPKCVILQWMTLNDYFALNYCPASDSANFRK